MPRTRLALAAIAATGLIGGLAAFLATGTAANTRPGQLIPYEDAQAIARGETLYAEHCADCHGAELEGQVPDWRQPGPDGLLPAPPHDETGHTWHHPDALLLDIVTRGTEAVVGGDYRSGMPGFEGVLSQDEILATLAYIKSTWPDRVIAVHDGINADAAAFGN